MTQMKDYDIDNYLAEINVCEFVGLGQRLSLRTIECPAYLLAGANDDITTKEQVFNADLYLGTPQDLICKTLVPGGHIGLFMGSTTLRDHWPEIAHWIAENGWANRSG